ncbi:putative PWWP domain-containing protein [Helianthus annuus]|uniref:PWWP domain-containing protein n=1 Tax=Helianthus annuus TaxID=4232 RepID=A0A251TN31_HELAN|nr:putative PWWP domain-containing protein [Helianthus annuus]
MVDYCVGTIVWVQMRNGSWWPGKILGSDERSASHLISPKSGTPVKLLGREDASVDWYNLEKSKRVKPFRCGEDDGGGSGEDDGGDGGCGWCLYIYYILKVHALNTCFLYLCAYKTCTLCVNGQIILIVNRLDGWS